MADTLRHVGYVVRSLRQGDKALERYEHLLHEWHELRNTMPKEFLSALLARMPRLVHQLQVAVEYFCRDLVESHLTRPDILGKVRGVLRLIADGTPQLPGEVYGNILLPGDLDTEDIPERDLTDNLLQYRREVAVAFVEIVESGQEVPEHYSAQVRDLDVQVLSAIDTALKQ